MVRPVDQLSVEGAKERGIDLTPKKRLRDRQTRSKKRGRAMTNYNTPTHTWWVGTTYALQRNAAQSPVISRLATASLYATTSGRGWFSVSFVFSPSLSFTFLCLAGLG